MFRHLLPVTALAVLSPFVAEFLLADQYLIGPVGFQQLGAFLLFVLFYGFGAVTIREAARRAGRGWPTIVLLALAFGVLEEGLLTQSLFNPGYADAHLLDVGFIPALGIAGPWTVFVLTLHTVWSICAPIAVVEACFGTEPRLRVPGRWVAGVLFLLGSAATFAVSYAMGTHFLAPLPRLLVAAAVTVLLVLAAFTVRGPATVRSGRTLPSFGFGLLATSGFQLARELPGPWVAVLLLAIIALSVLVIVRWLPADPFGLGAGAIVTYCWTGLLTAIQYGTAAAVEQSILVAVTLLLLAAARRRSPVLAHPVIT